MTIKGFVHRIIWVICVTLFLPGCNVPIAPPATLPPAIPPPTNGQYNLPVSQCRGDESSPMAVISSTDNGATWTPLGHLCYHDSSILSVDCTALPADDGIALYFIDMKLLQQPESVQRILYRAVSRDGVNFDKPQPVLTSKFDMVDPAVIRMLDGRIRLYVPTSEFDMQAGLLSAVSNDGLNFTREGPVKLTGGMPGALVLPDGRVRVFSGGEFQGQRGIISLISDDGLAFTQETGLRIAAASPRETDMPGDPSPIRLLSGGYMMAFMINPTSPQNAIKAQYRLATSDDGFNWIVHPTIFAEGGTSCLVERSDGTLFFYFGT